MSEYFNLYANKIIFFYKIKKKIINYYFLNHKNIILYMNIKKICSFKDHKEIEAITYCHICKIYMCNKCSIYHDSLFENNQYSLNKDINELFLDILTKKKIIKIN